MPFSNVFKVTWSYVNANGPGWSDTLYLQGSVPAGPNPFSAYGPIITAAEGLGHRRALLLGVGVKISYIRCVLLPNSPPVLPVPAGDSLIPHGDDLTFAGTGASANPGTPGSADFSDTALEVQMQSNQQARAKSLFMRGQIDDAVNAGGLYVGASLPRWVTNFDSWAAFITSNALPQFGWLGSSGLPKLFVAGITSIAQDVLSGRLIIVLTAPVPGAAPSVRLNFHQCRPLTLLRGRKLCSISPTDRHIVTTSRPIPYVPGFQPGIANVSVDDFQFVKADGVRVIRVVERKAGRPSYQSAGRARRLVP